MFSISFKKMTLSLIALLLPTSLLAANADGGYTLMCPSMNGNQMFLAIRTVSGDAVAPELVSTSFQKFPAGAITQPNGVWKSWKLTDDLGPQGRAVDVINVNYLMIGRYSAVIRFTTDILGSQVPTRTLHAAVLKGLVVPNTPAAVTVLLYSQALQPQLVARADMLNCTFISHPN